MLSRRAFFIKKDNPVKQNSSVDEAEPTQKTPVKRKQHVAEDCDPLVIKQKKKRRVLVDSDDDDECVNKIFDEGCVRNTDCKENTGQVGNSPSLHERNSDTFNARTPPKRSTGLKGGISLNI